MNPNGGNFNMQQWQQHQQQQQQQQQQLLQQQALRRMQQQQQQQQNGGQFGGAANNIGINGNGNVNVNGNNNPIAGFAPGMGTDWQNSFPYQQRLDMSTKVTDMIHKKMPHYDINAIQAHLKEFEITAFASSPTQIQYDKLWMEKFQAMTGVNQQQQQQQQQQIQMQQQQQQQLQNQQNSHQMALQHAAALQQQQMKNSGVAFHPMPTPIPGSVSQQQQMSMQAAVASSGLTAEQIQQVFMKQHLLQQQQQQLQQQQQINNTTPQLLPQQQNQEKLKAFISLKNSITHVANLFAVISRSVVKNDPVIARRVQEAMAVPMVQNYPPQELIPSEKMQVRECMEMIKTQLHPHLESLLYGFYSAGDIPEVVEKGEKLSKLRSLLEVQFQSMQTKDTSLFSLDTFTKLMTSLQEMALFYTGNIREQQQQQQQQQQGPASKVGVKKTETPSQIAPGLAANFENFQAILHRDFGLAPALIYENLCASEAFLYPNLLNPASNDNIRISEQLEINTEGDATFFFGPSQLLDPQFLAANHPKNRWAKKELYFKGIQSLDSK